MISEKLKKRIRIIKNFPKNYNSYDMQRINNEITRKSTSIMITDVINTISEKSLEC